jgi:hypothetical protein
MFDGNIPNPGSVSGEHDLEVGEESLRYRN